MMYTVRLKKVRSPLLPHRHCRLMLCRSTQISHNNDMAIARQRLADEYGLGEDPDVLCSRADELHSAMCYAECFKITSQ